jgi:hypothetical protein
MGSPGRRWTALLLLALAGCGRTPAPEGSGAKEVAGAYHEALLRQDWTQAYRFLHAESRARCSAERFARFAQGQRRGFGFEPQAVQLRFCAEQGAEALAHVVFTGQAGGRQRRFKDAVTLRRGPEGWGVVLPSRFGMTH